MYEAVFADFTPPFPEQGVLEYDKLFSSPVENQNPADEEKYGTGNSTSRDK